MGKGVVRYDSPPSDPPLIKGEWGWDGVFKALGTSSIL